MDVVWDNRALLQEGLKYSFKLFAVVLVVGTLLGTLFGIGALYGHVVIRAVLRAYVDILRGMPLLVTIFLIFYGLPSYGINLSPFQSISIALSAFAAAQPSMGRKKSVLILLAARLSSSTPMKKAIEVSLNSEMKVLLSDGRTVLNMIGLVMYLACWKRVSPSERPAS